MCIRDRVWVAAPEHQCSGMSVRLTISEKSQMAVYRYDFPVPVEAAWSVDGTPADCVKVALNALLPFRPDIVPVSYTHLDVYKRQEGYASGFCEDGSSKIAVL